MDPPEPPEPGPHRYTVLVAYCYECREVFGPTLAENVGEELARNHLGHLTKTIDEWEHVEY
ncbi:hypothetical protein HUG10_21075 (plasmid) [Halorarum halophilum]|uniref:Uncharacterized protein n=1 Tax=Halorarum halophilum TaxID=2743090 RepID=A0A7D5K414_9EURY|nr:hypothetical protein [Halobaculum halophilum]QLG30081.1 hypothetical protein HUG10_21075 [Halobaculum halophilum]